MNFVLLRYDGELRLLVIALVADAYGASDCIIDENRLNKAQTVIAIGKGFGIDLTRSHTYGDAEN